MEKRLHHLAPLLLLFPLLISACGTPLLVESQPQMPGLAETLAIQTMLADDAKAILVYSPTPPPTSTHSPKSTSYPTSTPLPTMASPPTSTPLPPLDSITPNADQSGGNPGNTPNDDTSNSESPLRVTLINSDYIVGTNAPCNAAEFITDVTIPDDMTIKPKSKFTKVWALRNVGTCTWTKEYAMVLIWGNQMGTHPPIPLDREVKPGQSVEIAIDMVAPAIPLCYQGNWMFQDGSGNRFGVGASTQAFVWVSVTVWWSKIPKFIRA